MLEKGKSKTIINSSLQNISQAIEKDQYDSNNQLYLNTLSSTHRTIQSAERSPKANYKTTILSERISKIVDMSKQSLMPRAMTMQEKDKRGNKVNLELYKIITFENIGQDQNGNEILISKTKDISTDLKMSQGKHFDSMATHSSITERGGVVNLIYQTNYIKDEQSNGVTINDLSNYQIMKEKGLLFIHNIIKQYNSFNRKYFIEKLRISSENKSNKGQCKALLRKLRTIQLRNNKSSSSVTIDKTLNDSHYNRNLILQFKKRFIKQSFYSKVFVSAETASSIKLIQAKWRQWKLNKRNSKIMMRLINKFPLLKEKIDKKKKNQSSFSSEKRKGNVLKSSSTNNKNMLLKDNQSVITINKIPPYSLCKINKQQIRNIEEKVILIQKNWKSSHQNQTQSLTSIKSMPSLSLLTKAIHTKQIISLSDSMIVIKAFAKKLNEINWKYNQASKSYFFIKIKKSSETINSKNSKSIKETLRLAAEEITHKVKFSYSIGKILSKSIQGQFFYFLKRINQCNINYNSNTHSLYQSFYYKTLRNHLMLIETFSKQNPIEDQSKLYVQLSLCQYFSLSFSLDFYSLYWNDKEREIQNELALTNDAFKHFDRAHLITYITLFINAYYKQVVIDNPLLLHFIHQHLSLQQEHFNTSIFGISRYINDFVDVVIVQKVPFCPKCSCFSFNSSFHHRNDSCNDKRTQCKSDSKGGVRRRAKSNVDLKGVNVKVIEQRIETFDDKRHIIKVSIERTARRKQKPLESIITRQMRYVDDVKFYNLAKEVRFKLSR